jgi:hypothetical protein
MRELLLAIVLAAPACAWTNTNSAPAKLSDSRRTMAPDGGPAWAIACTRSISECYDENARVCPHGYDILDKNNESYSSQMGAVGANGWAVANRSSTVDRISMLISCRAVTPEPAGPNGIPSAPPPAAPSAQR